MKVLVSACLLGEKCKYNGESNYNQHVIDFLKDDEIIPICPEVIGGMSIPRLSCEFFEGRVIDASGEDVTEFFENGVTEVCKILEEQKIERAIHSNLILLISVLMADAEVRIELIIYPVLFAFHYVLT